MTFPSPQPPVPAIVGRLAGGRSVHAVWVNAEGGATFRVGSDIPGTAGREFIKVANANVADFAGEARRLRRGWLRTQALPGPSAVHPRWLAAPDLAVRAIGRGLQMLHHRLPVRSYPFD